MSINDITLAGGMRSALTSLQMFAALQARTTERLSTGKRVNSAVDDPSAYFAAQNHMSRASDLAARKDMMAEAIQTVRTATEGIDAITSLIQQAKGIAESARGGTSAERTALSTQYDELLTQIDELAGDALYRGRNLLDSDTLTVTFNEDGTSTLTITGFDGTSSGLSIDGAANAWAADTDIDGATTDLDAALVTLRTNAKSLAANLSVVTTRQEFTVNLINTLTGGADLLTAADQNEEGANLLALQTRQQLGITALSLTSQTQQSILKLF
jgi:flagellin-like hook-associated protein FlgL